MAEFSRIQVTPAEEEDIVIMAGAVEDPVPTASDDASHDEGIGSAVFDGVAADEKLSEEDVAFDERHSTAPRVRSVDYEETTLDDLQRTRMSGMQKAIIALAIVAVAAFIIWYVFLH